MFPPDSPKQPTYIPTHIVRSNIFSYDGNIMLAAVISLLLVIFFVLLLYVYAKWFLAQAQQRRRRSMTVSHIRPPSRIHHFHTFEFDTSVSNSPREGLDASVIATIPLFEYSSEEQKALECVICLSPFEEKQLGRNLPKCHHGFHLECIDMWLSSHSNCPICRAPAACEAKVLTVGTEANDGTSAVDSFEGVGVDQLGVSNGDSALEIVIDVPNSENVTDQNVVAGDTDSMSVSSSSSSSLSCSLKWLLNRNRSENDQTDQNVVEESSLSMCSSSSSLGCSLKMILSRNRSSERKVFPSYHANEL
ncbi:hypothetical protein F2P56_032294 [Juglans regia]|uniref:RING-type E3 ubiquitin transferase n=2 Tax=Juglans regia TaxID=51240 RepID=A0A2I4FUL9_JUGRE|nr:RING-H2 finger protein ATL63-like [Juglans regia]KAF5446685.1 hypothetical protein F2P56_032294 [Juglans regia]